MANDLFSELRSDHQQVRDIFSKLETANREGERRNLLNQLQQELLPHMEGEEKIVYPSLQNISQASEDVQESYQEHGMAREQLGILLKTSPSDASFMEKAMQLREMVSHHLDEEEDRIFSDLRKNKSDDDLRRLLDGFQQQKQETLRVMASSATH